MLRRKALIAAVGASLALGATAFAPAAHANRVAFNLSFGGPGYGVTVGNAPYYYGPHYYHRGWRPAYVPAPVYVAPPVVYRAPVVVAPAYAYRYPYAGRVYYRY
jgi:hypothetical protein